MTNKSSLSYKDAGVDIAAGNALVEKIKPLAAKTRRPELLGGIGGFSALFELPIDRYRQPVLVSATDGVGTKLKLAFEMDQHKTIGIDLVAMCVNDLIVCGAEPLFFLDYYATAKLDVNVAADVIAGISEGCQQAGAALVGGETAEMPGVYQPSEYDLAGFCVGVVEKSEIIDGKKVKPGDKLIGLASSGPHSNGYSLIRHIIAERKSDLKASFLNSTLGETLLTPTRIYVKSILNLLKHIPIHAMAHITGGGLIENLPRVLPPHTMAAIDRTSWPMPDIFAWLQTEGNVADNEMYKTFNCGLGMVICVAEQDADHTLTLLEKMGEHCWVIGEIVHSEEEKPQVLIG